MDMVKAIGILVIAWMIKTYYLGVDNLVILIPLSLPEETGNVLCSNCLKHSSYAKSTGSKDISSANSFVDAIQRRGKQKVGMTQKYLSGRAGMISKRRMTSPRIRWGKVRFNRLALSY